MTIYADTRQKVGKHDVKHRQIVDNGHILLSKKLDIGDYMRPDGKISVDTKQDLQEIYSNLFTDHARFLREVRKAYRRGVTLVVLVEQDGIRSVEDVCKWDPGHGLAHGRQLYDRMRDLYRAYGVQFAFCGKNDTGKKIIEILEGDTYAGGQAKGQ